MSTEQIKIIQEIIDTLKEIKKTTVSSYITFLCNNAIQKLEKLIP